MYYPREILDKIQFIKSVPSVVKCFIDHYEIYLPPIYREKLLP